MARQRCVLPLIIVSTLVFTTVITAFRLRDAPTTSQIKNPLTEKCVGCESDIAQKVQTPSRLSYEDVKKAVKEKQQTVNEKRVQQHKVTFTTEDSDEDGDEDDEEIKGNKISSTKEIKASIYHQKDKSTISYTDLRKRGGSTSSKINPKKIQTIAKDSGSENDDEEDDEDDEGDDDDDEDGDGDDNDENEDSDNDENDDDLNDDDDGKDESGDESEEEKIPTIVTGKISALLPSKSKENEDKPAIKHELFVRHTVPKKLEDLKMPPVKKQKDDSDDDTDKNDDDEDDDNDSDDDDDTENDSEDDRIIKVQKVKPTETSKVQEKKFKSVLKEPPVKLMPLQKTENTKKILIKKGQKDVDDSDDGDDNDDDDDDSSDDDNNLRNIPKVKSLQPVSDSHKTGKSESLKVKKNLAPEKPQKVSLIKEIQSKETKPPVKVSTKDVKEPADKDKKDKTKDDVKIDHKTYQELKQSHDKEQKTHDSKKSERKMIKDDVKHPPKEEKKKEHVEKEVKNEVKKVEFKSEKPKIKNDSIEKHSDQSKTERKHQKEKDVLEHASEALFRKNNFLQSEFEDFYAFLPSFAPNFSRIHNPECRRQGQILMRQLRGTKLWALNMLDASGKIPSGILEGNGNQLGDFDQCLGSKARVRLDSGHVVKIHGKYCLAQIDMRSDDPELRLPIHLAQARNLVKSKIDDPGHFIPRFSSLNWGVCLPASCGPEEAEFVLRDALRHYHLAGLHLKINVDEINCHTTDDESLEDWLEPETLVTISLFSVILLTVLYATLQDYLTRRSSTSEESEESKEQSEDEKPEEGNAEKTGNEDGSNKCANDGILASFSLYNSCFRLLRDGDTEDIACIHGVRALCSLTLLLAHKIIPVANVPFTNRVRLTELSQTSLSFPLRMGWLYTDAFLLLSGALTAHRLSADLDGGGMPWLRRYVARYVRLTPALLFCVLFYAFVWDKLGHGPLWGTLVSENARLCQESWWWNLLYVQNFFAFDEMCAPQTYQLALDMQLTLTAAALVWLVRARPLPAAGSLLALQAITAYARYSTTAEHRLSLLIYHGASVSQLYRTARLTYTSALHRSTPYVFGVVLGVLLQRRPSTHMSLFLKIPCWLLCLGLGAGSTYAVLDAASSDVRYSASEAANYAALAPIAAAAALAWIIYAAHSGNAHRVNRLLCAKPLVIISRLSYAMYLCQFVVFFTNAATVRTSSEFNIFSILDIPELATILAASTVMTLTLIIPMQSLSKFVMSYQFGTKEQRMEEPQEDNNSQDDTAVLTEEVDDQPLEPEEEIEDVTENYIEHKLMAHRELLEEIMEAEVEYESQRDERDEGLEEILEEEEDELGEEEIVGEEEITAEEVDMEVVERSEVEEGGVENFWGQQEEEYVPRSSSRMFNSRGGDEWEWSGQGSSSRYR